MITDRSTYTANLSARHFPDWRQFAKCTDADPELFYVDVGESIRAAKAICATCPAIKACREFALEHNEKHGVWGGTSVRDRRAIRAGKSTELMPDFGCGHPRTPENSRHNGHGAYRCRKCHDKINQHRDRRKAA